MDKRIALVTGASRGIGRAMALARDGGHVLLNFRNRQADAEKTLATITHSRSVTGAVNGGVYT